MPDGPHSPPADPAAEQESLRVYVAIAEEEFDLLFSAASRELLHALGEVQYPGGGESAALPEGVADDFDAIVTSWSTLPFGADLVTGPRLKIAVHAGGSVKALFPPELLDGGLRLTQGGADAMAPAVAEMAVALSLALLRNIHRHDRALWSGGDWAAAGHGMLGRSLGARNIGIVGLSRAGIEFARMVTGLGASELRAYDPYASPEVAEDLGVTLLSLDALFESCDLVSVHVPSTPETRHLIGGRQLGLLRDGAILINTARSSSVDQAALLTELAFGRINAGLDVFDEEPLPASSPFLGLDNVIVTPHVAGGTREARLAQGRTVAEELGRFARGEPLLYEVTPGNYGRLA